jgi:hypothetical protein
LTTQLRIILITIESDSQLRGPLMLRAIVVSCLMLLAAFAAAAAPRLPAQRPARLALTQVDAHFGSASGDVDFLFRLGMLEGHLMIGHELIQANQPALALPHFGHPVRELYDDIADYLSAQKFAPFDKQLASLEAAVAAAPSSPDTEAQYQAAIATIHKARDLAPAELRASLPEMIKVCASTIDAASGEYGGALERGRVAALVEYHDSRGYLEYAAQQLGDLKALHRDPQSQALLDRFGAVLAKAQWIVGELLPAPTPRASVATYRSIVSEARDIAQQ